MRRTSYMFILYRAWGNKHCLKLAISKNFKRNFLAVRSFVRSFVRLFVRSFFSTYNLVKVAATLVEKKTLGNYSEVRASFPICLFFCEM